MLSSFLPVALGPVGALILSLATALGLGAGSSAGNPPTGVEQPAGDPGEPEGAAGKEWYWRQQTARDDLLVERPRSWDSHRQLGPNTIRIYFLADPCSGHRAEVHETGTEIRIDLYDGVIPPAGEPVEIPGDGADLIAWETELRVCELVLHGRFLDVETGQPVGDRAVVQRRP